jgi:hypothetical protein
MSSPPASRPTGERAPILTTRIRTGWRRQLLLFLAAYGAYNLARWVFAGDPSTAVRHGHWILRLERGMGVAIEASVQHALAKRTTASQQVPTASRSQHSSGRRSEADPPARAHRASCASPPPSRRERTRSSSISRPAAGMTSRPSRSSSESPARGSTRRPAPYALTSTPPGRRPISSRSRFGITSLRASSNGLHACLEASNWSGGTRSAQEGLGDQETVEADDEGGDEARQSGRRAAVGEFPHQLAVGGQEHQRDEGEGDPEAQDDL